MGCTRPPGFCAALLWGWREGSLKEAMPDGLLPCLSQVLQSFFATQSEPKPGAPPGFEQV